MNILETPELATETISPIGLDKTKCKDLARKLNILLASYSTFYQNVRGYHWNLKGERFFELHLKFEELYGDLYLKIDDIAERILTIGFSAKHNFSDYIMESKIMERIHVSDGIKASQDVLNSLKIVISLQREILSMANEINDEGTYSLMKHNIRVQEKLVWMYTSYLEK